MTIELESETEAERVVAIGERLGIRPRVAVRVNPDFQVKGSGMRMGGGPQQFGVDAEQVPALLGELAGADLEFLGLPHLRRLAEPATPRSSARPSARPSSWRCALADDAPAPIRYLNLGGGFGIPYFEQRRAARPRRDRRQPRGPAWPTRSARACPTRAS